MLTKDEARDAFLVKKNRNSSLQAVNEKVTKKFVHNNTNRIFAVRSKNYGLIR
jgi:hypothetical protein